MSDPYTYARFWRCALQVNPVGYSKAYRGECHGMSEEEYNNKLRLKCQELGIKIVGLADHGCVDSIDKLRYVLECSGIVVFPGFEITSTENIHIVCLFPEDTTKDKLERFLGSLELTNPDEKVMPSKLDIIEENLGNAAGRIEVEVISSSQHGKPYRVSRRYGETPIVRDESGSVSTLKPHDLMPGIDIYGQNEIMDRCIHCI